MGREVEEDRRRDGLCELSCQGGDQRLDADLLSHVCILPSRRTDERSREKPIQYKFKRKLLKNKTYS